MLCAFDTRDNSDCNTPHIQKQSPPQIQGLSHIRVCKEFRYYRVQLDAKETEIEPSINHRHRYMYLPTQVVLTTYSRLTGSDNDGRKTGSSPKSGISKEPEGPRALPGLYRILRHNEPRYAMIVEPGVHVLISNKLYNRMALDYFVRGK